MKPVKIKIDLTEANKILAKLSAQERIKRVVKKISEGVVSTTSGGRTSRILPNLIQQALGKSVPTIFVDTGLYPQQTYQFLDKMEKDGIDIRYYSPKMSIKRLQALYGDLWEREGAEFDYFLGVIKHEPLNRAFRQLNANLWIRGIMGFQTEERQRTSILEYKNGLYRLHPIVDWSQKQAKQYLEKSNLPVNHEHYDLTKGLCGKKECKIGEKSGFIGGGGI
ncbi:MAG: phosphoadenosine phosphosulfate reductase family protein [Candidatus Omnitrophica bacterium]|nr:phosphoadenosine phosphosulfate reductase family protein [Candidatus Omnitrophota bacterium]